MVTGEAKFDASGLKIKDLDQDWSLRLGEISSEMVYDAAQSAHGQTGLGREWELLRMEELAREPIFGVHWSIAF